MNKITIALIVVIIIAFGVGVFVYSQNKASIEKADITWKFEDKGEDSVALAPKTAVTVTVKGKSYDAGTYVGSCAELRDSGLTKSEGEISGVICWFAGTGDEIGVFKEGSVYVLKHGEVQEGTEESGGFRGNFKTLVSF